MDELGTLVEAGIAAGHGARGGARPAPATPPSCPASSDPQDETRLENLQELVAVAREFEEASPEGTLVDFLEQVSLVADADQIPDEPEDGEDGAPTPAWSR